MCRLRIGVSGIFVLRPSFEYTARNLVSTCRSVASRCKGAHSPEIFDDFVLLRVASIVGVFLPVLDINVCNTTDKKFKLAFIEDVD